MVSSRILGIIALVLILFVCALGSLTRNNPGDISPKVITVVVTATPAPTPTVDTYAVQLVRWLRDIDGVNATVLRVLRNQSVTEQELRTAGATIGRVQNELHTTVPPVLYRKTHTQLTDCVDLYIAAVRDYGNGDIAAGNAKLDLATALMRTLPDTMPQRQ